MAVLGAAGLAMGLALQGHIGVVKDVQIFNMVSPQNRRIILPNGSVSNGSINTAEGFVRVDLTIGISHDSDIAKAKQVLLDVMAGDDKVLNDPAPFVGVAEMGDSSVNLALDANNITIPFPQRDVHLINR